MSPSAERPGMRLPVSHIRQEVNTAAAWAVLRCARDLFDIPMALIAQRVIAAYLRGEQPRAEDLKTIRRYFR